MTPAPNVALVAEPPTGRSGLLPVQVRDAWRAVRRALRALNPVWPDPASQPGALPAARVPGAAAQRGDLDDRLLDHLAG